MLEAREPTKEWSLGRAEAASSQINNPFGSPINSPLEGGVATNVRGGRAINTEQSKAESRIAAGAKLTGDFEFDGTVEIDCELEGEIEVRGTLIVGKNATIKANVFAERVIVHGSVYGDIRAHQAVQATHEAVILGNILSPVIVFKEGVHFRGRCWMSEEALKDAKKPE